MGRRPSAQVRVMDIQIRAKVKQTTNGKNNAAAVKYVAAPAPSSLTIAALAAKPAETRMGSGKGSVEYYVAVIKPGTMMFEVAGVPISVAREAMRLADTKLQVRCRFLAREELEKY